jgi:hypothetical protein
LAAIVIAGVAAGCAGSGGVTGEDWSRTYLQPYDRVFEAVLDALEASGFYLDTVDEERGRVRAEPSTERDDRVTLVVEVALRGDRVRVDALAQSPELADGFGSGLAAAAVRDFLRDLDARLGGRVD